MPSEKKFKVKGMSIIPVIISFMLSIGAFVASIISSSKLKDYNKLIDTEEFIDTASKSITGAYELLSKSEIYSRYVSMFRTIALAFLAVGIIYLIIFFAGNKLIKRKQI